MLATTALGLPPFVKINIHNVTYLKTNIDIQIDIIVNNTKYFEIYGKDVFTTLVLTYEYHCGLKLNNTKIYVLKNPVDYISISAQSLFINTVCQEKPTTLTKINLTIIQIQRNGYVDKIFYDTIKLNKTIVPEWRLVDFRIRTEVIDPGRWIRYTLEYPYGGIIAMLDVISWGKFNHSNAVRIVFRPTYHFITKYLDIILYVNNYTMRLPPGGEVIIPQDIPIYGNITKLEIELKALMRSALVNVLNNTGSINIVPQEKTEVKMEGMVAETKVLAKEVQLRIVLTDAVSPEGLKTTIEPAGPTYYVEVEKPNVLILHITPTAPIQGNLTVKQDVANLVKNAVIPLPALPIKPVTLNTIAPLVNATFYPISLQQPQPLLRLEIPLASNTLYVYNVVNITAKPRTPGGPIYIFPVVFYRVEGALVPHPSNVLVNSTTGGYYIARNTTFTISLLTPVVKKADAVVIYLYGGNIAEFKAEGRTLLYVDPEVEEPEGRGPDLLTQLVVGLAVALPSLILSRRL